MKIKLKSFKSIIEERIKLHINKGITIYFNDYHAHKIYDKLTRAELTQSSFKSNLNKISSYVKKNKCETCEITFCFDDYKVPCKYVKEEKSILIRTILTKTMPAKRGDTLVRLEDYDDLESPEEFNYD